MNNLQAIANLPVKPDAVSPASDAAPGVDPAGAPQEPFQEVLKQQISDAKTTPHAKDLAIALGELIITSDDTELTVSDPQSVMLQDAAQLFAWLQAGQTPKPAPAEYVVDDAQVSADPSLVATNPSAAPIALLQAPVASAPAAAKASDNADPTQLSIAKDDPALIHDQPLKQIEPNVKAAAPLVRADVLAKITDGTPNLSTSEGNLAAGQAAQALHTAPAPTLAPTSAAHASLQVNTLIGHSGWADEVGQKLTLMIGAKQHVAELHIVPPQLGPIDIKLTVDGNQTTAVFTSPHSEVRHTLEASLPRLREVLAESGIMLGNASVTADSPRDGAAFAQQQSGSRGPADLREDVAAEPAAIRTLTLPRSRGGVDLFA